MAAVTLPVPGDGGVAVAWHLAEVKFADPRIANDRHLQNVAEVGVYGRNDTPTFAPTFGAHGTSKGLSQNL